MADPPVPQVSLSDLGPMTRIDSGGQGTVFALAEDPSVVYKEYAPRFVDDVDVTTLGRFARLAAGDDSPDAAALLRLAAWPTAIVRKGAPHGRGGNLKYRRYVFNCYHRVWLGMIALANDSIGIAVVKPSVPFKWQSFDFSRRALECGRRLP